MLLENSFIFFPLYLFLFFFLLPLPKILFVYVIDSAMVLHPPERAEEGGGEPGTLISKPEPDFFQGPSGALCTLWDRAGAEGGRSGSRCPQEPVPSFASLRRRDL